MRAVKLTFERFRNLQAGALCPDPKMTLIVGENAQGKTNLIEALWMFTGGKSFRGAADAELIAFDRDNARLELDFSADGRDQTAVMDIRPRRSVTLNGVKKRSAVEMSGVFCAVVFSPAHLSLMKDGPAARRRFVDAAFCQIKPGYPKMLMEYQKTLAERNALLKSIGTGYSPTDFDGLMEVYDRRLAISGASIVAARTAYVRRLSQCAAAIYDGLSSGREALSLQYDTPIEGDTREERFDRFLRLLKDNISRDKAAGFTTVGPHRDDLEVRIGGHEARLFASQGQQRSAVLAMKLGEAELLKEVTGEWPVVLLDDVMSELDLVRQDYVLQHIEGRQTFITCCDPSPSLRHRGGKLFHVKQGVATEKVLQK